MSQAVDAFRGLNISLESGDIAAATGQSVREVAAQLRAARVRGQVKITRKPRGRRPALWALTVVYRRDLHADLFRDTRPPSRR